MAMILRLAFFCQHHHGSRWLTDGGPSHYRHSTNFDQSTLLQGGKKIFRLVTRIFGSLRRTQNLVSFSSHRFANDRPTSLSQLSCWAVFPATEFEGRIANAWGRWTAIKNVLFGCGERRLQNQTGTFELRVRARSVNWQLSMHDLVLWL